MELKAMAYLPQHVVAMEGSHPQIDSGIGFECDESVLDLVLALNRGRIFTYYSCQGPWENWFIPRMFVMFGADSHDTLLRFCLCLQESVLNLYGELFSYGCDIQIDSAISPRKQVRACLTIPQRSAAELIIAIEQAMVEIFTAAELAVIPTNHTPDRLASDTEPQQMSVEDLRRPPEAAFRTEDTQSKDSAC